jgi:hypothetical protein
LPFSAEKDSYEGVVQMAEKKETVVALGQCKSEKCSKKEERMGFCSEHYAWFKAGLINRAGQRPPDFDKKYQAFTHKKKAA